MAVISLVEALPGVVPLDGTGLEQQWPVKAPLEETLLEKPEVASGRQLAQWWGTSLNASEMGGVPEGKALM